MKRGSINIVGRTLVGRTVVSVNFVNVVYPSTPSQILTKAIQAQNIDKEHKTPTGDFCQDGHLMKVWRTHKY